MHKQCHPLTQSKQDRGFFDWYERVNHRHRQMEGAELELERRSKFLSSLIQKKKSVEQQDHHELLNVRVRASDMPTPLQNRAFRSARDHLDSMPGKLDSKRLALALKKVTSLPRSDYTFSLSFWDLILLVCNFVVCVSELKTRTWTCLHC